MVDTHLAEEIITRAMNDPEVYDEMSAQEKACWGKRLSDSEFLNKRKSAQQAARKLGKNQGKIKMLDYFRAIPETLNDGLVLGCGNGRAERLYLRLSICKRFHGIDFAEDAINMARDLAEEIELPITYELADLNKLKLKENTYDFISAQNFLHHVLFLEDLIKQIWISIKPGGYLVVDDFVGETQFQWHEKRMKICQDLLDMIPKKHRTNSISGKIVELRRPTPGTLCSPFEAIRSGEIVELLKKRFHIQEERLAGSFRYHLLPVGVLESYIENEETKTFYTILKYFDELLVKEGVLAPTSSQMILRPKGK